MGLRISPGSVVGSMSALVLVVASSGPSLATPALLWSDTRDLAGRPESAADVAVSPGVVVSVGSLTSASEDSDFAVRAHDAATGSLLWEDRHDVGSEDQAVAVSLRGGVAIAAGVVGSFAAWDFAVRAYDAASGDLLWADAHDASHNDWATDVDAAGRFAVAVGSLGPALAVRTYEARTGSLLWQDASEPGLARAVAVRGRTVVVAGSEVRAYDLKTGALRWSDVSSADRWMDVALGSRVAVVVGERCFAESCSDGDLAVRAYDLRSGEVLWSDVHDHAARRDRATAVAVQGRHAFVVGSLANPFFEDATIRAYELRSGDIPWADLVSSPGDNDDTAHAVAVKGSIVLLAARLAGGSAVRAYHRQTGELLWEYDDPLIVGDPAAVALATSQPWAFVAGSGTFLPDREQDTDFAVRAYHLAGGELPSNPRFVDQGDGTVLDRRSGLLWEMKTAPGSGLTAADAVFTWCADVSPADFVCDDPSIPPDGTAFTELLPHLNGGLCGGTCAGLGGYGDWRLPSFLELRSISRCGHGTGTGNGVCLDPAFGPVGSDWHSSSTQFPSGAVGVLEFDFGFWSSSGPARAFHVRAVRGTSREPTR